VENQFGAAPEITGMNTVCSGNDDESGEEIACD
jgi:hypothetical protein